MRILLQFEIGVQLATDTDIWFGSKIGLFLILPASKRPGSSVGTATGYGLDGPWIESRWDAIFRRPDRPWGPPSILYNEYRVFPRGRKRPGRDADPSPPSSSEVWKKSRAIALLSLRAFVAYKKGETYLPTCIEFWQQTLWKDRSAQVPSALKVEAAECRTKAVRIWLGAEHHVDKQTSCRLVADDFRSIT